MLCQTAIASTEDWFKQIQDQNVLFGLFYYIKYTSGNPTKDIMQSFKAQCQQRHWCGGFELQAVATGLFRPKINPKEDYLIMCQKLYCHSEFIDPANILSMQNGVSFAPWNLQISIKAH